MKTFFLWLISFYQRRISVFMKPRCVFYPSCSEYTKQAIEKYGVLRGIYLGLGRILRCHPWQKNHIDPLK
ncbi:MAG: membrane protein insertion efficiency factor YidD [Candidatus Pacebacteria bacterium]|nr:membrane protein insertion efficiency factor YidD [Candidatus Paceibacterota bacterium]